MTTTPTSGADGLPEALINIAREIEALKRDCGMDPESAIAIQNGRYMAISSEIRALAAGQVTAAQQAPAGWQPIETAPRDGQAILVTDGRGCYCVEWDEEFDWWTVDDNKLGPFRLRGSAPTHWMKLPESPYGKN